MRKVGLDPKNIKYVIISHAHGDHIGGAEMLQTRYGARVVYGWARLGSGREISKSLQDHGAETRHRRPDGMKITLGDTAVTIWLTPGHTPGTLSYTFTVLDHGKPVNVAYSGGTAFNFVNNTRIRASRIFRPISIRRSTSPRKPPLRVRPVILSNHSEFDNAVNKNRMLAGRGEGPHPYELGAEWVQRYFQVMQGCARAAQLRLEQNWRKQRSGKGLDGVV